MQKIHCPECNRFFMWTDDMPLTGKCPTDNCSWQYNVRGEVGKSVERRIMEREHLVPCPHCGKAIEDRLTICMHCGEVIIGRTFFKPGYLLFAIVILLLLLISVLIKFLN